MSLRPGPGLQVHLGPVAALRVQEGPSDCAPRAPGLVTARARPLLLRTFSLPVTRGWKAARL